MRGASAASSDAAPQVAATPGSRTRVDRIVGAKSVHLEVQMFNLPDFLCRQNNSDRASEDGGESGSPTVVDVVENPLVHHLPTVPLNKKL